MMPRRAEEKARSVCSRGSQSTAVRPGPVPPDRHSIPICDDIVDGVVHVGERRVQAADDGAETGGPSAALRSDVLGRDQLVDGTKVVMVVGVEQAFNVLFVQ